MGLGDIFKANENKQLTEQVADLKNQITELNSEIASLKTQLTPEHFIELDNKVNMLKQEERELSSVLKQLDEKKMNQRQSCSV